MATTEFTDTSTRIVSTWLNAVDAVVYDILNGATTVAAAKIALGIETTDNPTFTNLTLTGVIKIDGGSPGTGKVLTSDADGDATWQTLSVDTSTITIVDNDSTAFEVKEGTNSYINISTLNGTELVTFGNAVTTPDWTFTGDPHVGIGVASTTARLEVEDAGTGNLVLLKLTADDGGVYGLVIGNDTYSTNDVHGIRMHIDAQGYGRINAIRDTGQLGRIVFQGEGFPDYGLILDESSNALFGSLNTSTTPAARVEIEDGTTTKPVLLKITQDDQTVKGLIIGNDTFSTNDTYGLAAHVTNAGIATLLAAGTGAGMQIGVAADTDAVNIDATNGGLYMGGATGSSKGTGTINATGLYINGVSVGTTVTGGNAHDHDGGDGAAIPSGGIGSQAITSSKFKATSTETTQTGLLTTPYVLPSGLHWVTSFTVPSSESTTLQVYVNGGWRSTGLLINATPRVVWSDGTNMRITDTSNSPVVYIRSMD